MNRMLFDLIHKIAVRNGAIEYYPLQEFEDGGMRWLTCGGWLRAEISSEWLFSDVSDEEATTLLRAFALDEDCCTFEVQRHLARLMAIKGGLVRDLMDPIIVSTEWAAHSSIPMVLSYLATMENGADWILQLLDVVPYDGRDGLFTACWYCEDVRVQEKLLAKFEEWIQDDTWGRGDGEDVWMKDFLCKWIAKDCFSYERLKDLVVWHFKRGFRCL